MVPAKSPVVLAALLVTAWPGGWCVFSAPTPRPRVRSRGDRARLRMIPDGVFLRVGMS